MNLQQSHRLICGFATLLGANLIVSSQAQAVVYSINRSWDNDNATLTGTVEIPEGTYFINNSIFDPFLDIDLSLDYDGSSTILDRVDFSTIQNNGTFIIDANLSNLVFNTQNADGINPAVLSFTNISGDSYSTGSDSSPGFESSSFNGTSFDTVSFPDTFASVPSVAVPFEFTPGVGLVAISSLWGFSRIFKKKMNLKKSDH